MFPAILLTAGMLELQSPPAQVPPAPPAPPAQPRQQAPVPVKRIELNLPKPGVQRGMRPEFEGDEQGPPLSANESAPGADPDAAAAAAAATAQASTAPAAPLPPPPAAPAPAAAAPPPAALGAGTVRYAPVFLMAMLLPMMIGAVFVSTRRPAPETAGS